MDSLSGFVSRRAIERLQQKIGVCEGITPIIAMVHLDKWNDEFEQELFKWLWVNVGIQFMLDSELDNKPIRYLGGYVETANFDSLLKNLKGFFNQKLNGTPADELESETKTRFNKERLDNVEKWLQDFRDTFLTLSNKTNLKLPKLGNDLLWWGCFRTHLKSVVPSIGAVRSWQSPLPVGNESDLFDVIQNKGRVLEAGLLIIPGDLKEKSEELFEFIFDWIDDGCPVDMPSKIRNETRPLPALNASETATQAETNSDRLAILQLYTNGLVGEKLNDVTTVFVSGGTLNERLEAMHELLPIPAKISAAKLGDTFGVSKTAIQKTAWYKKYRKDKDDEAIDRRHDVHKRRSEQYQDEFQEESYD